MQSRHESYFFEIDSRKHFAVWQDITELVSTPPRRVAVLPLARAPHNPPQTTPPPFPPRSLSAGQVPEASAGSDPQAQTASCLAQIDALLARAGSSKSRILSATVYLTDMSSYAGMNAAWEAWMPAGCGPARATVGAVTLAKPEWLVEIQIVAAVE